MFKNINAGLIASRASFLTNRNRLLYTRLIKDSTGEQVYSSSTGYVYHIFTQPGSFTMHTPGYVDIMLVGGGGGGGGGTDRNTEYSPYLPFHGAGGGGAGGVAHWYNKYMPGGPGTLDTGAGTGGVPSNSHMPGRYYVHVGAGGPAGGGGFIIDPGGDHEFGHKEGEPGNSSYIGAHLDDSPVGASAAQEWGMLVPSLYAPDTYPDVGVVHYRNPSSDPGRVSERLIAMGGGGGGFAGWGGLGRGEISGFDPDSHYVPGILGKDGGSQGGHGHLIKDPPGAAFYAVTVPGALANGNESWLHPEELPQGNPGGLNDAAPDPSGSIGGGGGGGAGSPGRYGQKSSDGYATLYAGAGGAGVAAFNGDTGIPNDYGTPGPANDPTTFTTPFPGSVPSGIRSNNVMLETRTRWFGGGGHGGFNDNWSWLDSVVRSYDSNSGIYTYSAVNGYVGGGGARFGPPGLSGSDNPEEFAENVYPFSHYQNGRANTGGGGCGGAKRGYGDSGVYPAGSGGSGIVIIRYQAAH